MPATICRSPQAIRSRPQAGISRQMVAGTFFRAQLLPLNPAFEPITPHPEDAGDLTIVGEFVRLA